MEAADFDVFSQCLCNIVQHCATLCNIVQPAWLEGCSRAASAAADVKMWVKSQKVRSGYIWIDLVSLRCDSLSHTPALLNTIKSLEV